MALDADYLVDRRRLKRRLAIWRLLAVLALVATVVVGVGRFTDIENSHYIARFRVTGVIVDDHRRHEALRDLVEERRAQALIVHIDSPGGTVVGGEALYRTLRTVASRKPVVVVMGQVATSAGYMVALAGDRILAHEGTITGSIGVILQTTEVTGLLGKLGIATEAIKSGPYKAVPSPLEPLTPAGRKITQQLVDDIYRMFVDMVAERRAMTPAKVATLADGRVYTGRVAVANGMIDAIGGETEAVAWLEQQGKVARGLPLRDVRARRNVRDWFGYLESLAQKTVFSERLTLDGLISVWHPQLR